MGTPKQKPNRRGSPKLVAKTGWMHGTPMNWITLILGVIAVGSTFSQWILTYADLRSANVTLERELKRNFDQDERRHDQHIKNIERIDTTIGSLSKMDSKIAVLDTQLKNIGDILQRVERQLERQSEKK